MKKFWEFSASQNLPQQISGSKIFFSNFRLSKIFPCKVWVLEFLLPSEFSALNFYILLIFENFFRQHFLPLKFFSTEGGVVTSWLVLLFGWSPHRSAMSKRSALAEIDAMRRKLQKLEDDVRSQKIEPVSFDAEISDVEGDG